MPRPAKHADTEPDRAIALEQLLYEIREAHECGSPVPCLGETRRLWISERGSSNRLAADACMDCAVFLACSTYVWEFPEPAGVWAGLTPSDRKQNTRSTR